MELYKISFAGPPSFSGPVETRLRRLKQNTKSCAALYIYIPSEECVERGSVPVPAQAGGQPDPEAELQIDGVCQGFARVVQIWSDRHR